MEENEIKEETQNSTETASEPVLADNSTAEDIESSKDNAELNDDGKSEPNVKDPSEELLLGKFKSVEDLSKAYQELQRQQGNSSDELGYLRKELASMNSIRKSLEQYQNMQSIVASKIREDQEKYNSTEYFQDPTFREIYKEAVIALGDNFDTDKFVNLLESYVSARIFANDRKKSASRETQKILDSMTYQKNPQNSITKPKKRFDEMTEAEVDEMLERLV